jgi:hypothetical protein
MLAGWLVNWFATRGEQKIWQQKALPNFCETAKTKLILACDLISLSLIFMGL